MEPSNNKPRNGSVRPRSMKPAKGSVATVRAVGVVDRPGIEACDYLLSKAGEQASGAVVDLSQATHFDYRATTILVARRRVFKARGGELAVAAGRADVRNILRASAGSEIPVFATVDEAVAFVRGEGDVVTAGASKQMKRVRSVKATRPV